MVTIVLRSTILETVKFNIGLKRLIAGGYDELNLPPPRHPRRSPCEHRRPFSTPSPHPPP